MMKRWDDLKILVAVARCGSITAGAEALGLDQSTASRRLQAFEAEVGHPMFQESSKRQTLSLVGQRIYEGAVRLEAEVEKIERDVDFLSRDQTGTVYVVASDTLSTHLLLSVAPAFLSQHPDINLRVRTRQHGKDRFRGDVALVASNSPDEEMFGRKLATATFACYASSSYLESMESGTDQIVWLNWDGGSASPTWPALAPDIPENACRLRIDSVSSLLEAVRRGIGATILPCFIGDSDPQLSRLPLGEIVSSRDIWLLVHSDVRRVARVRTFLEFLVGHVKDNRSLIEST